MNEHLRKGFAIAVLGTAVVWGQTAIAQTTADGTPAVVPGAAFGTQTDAWLSMQLNPAYTANDSRPIPGEVANRTFVRYLDSFSHPIPEQFERQSFSGSGGGSGGGGGAASSSSGSGGSSP